MKVTVLTGGVGGAKLVLGLMHSAQVSSLTAMVNTGDDFRHLGLAISPDIDTLLYTLAGKSNTTQGWGCADETWNFMAALKSLGGPDWFNLGDGDLGLHVWRSARLAAGATLSQVTAEAAQAWGIAPAILPMSDDRVATWLDTDAGPLAFQHYFVEQQCRPAVRAIRFEGAAEARPAPGVIAAIMAADAVLIAPSNPWLSVDPLLAVPGIADALRETHAPVVAVSPLVGGKAVKGPTGKLMAELGLSPDNAAIAAHYGSVIDAMLHDTSDAPPPDLPSRATSTLMTTLADKVRVADEALALAAALAR
jgi:LPPG:FO 2-phospho-L-lactate transferase